MSSKENTEIRVTHAFTGMVTIVVLIICITVSVNEYSRNTTKVEIAKIKAGVSHVR